MRAGWTGKHRRDVLEQLDSAVERSAGQPCRARRRDSRRRCVAAGAPGDHGEDDDPEAIDDPAARSERDRLTLPSVLRMPEPSSFIARTASTASPRTRVVLAHVRGAAARPRTPPSASWRARRRWRSSSRSRVSRLLRRRSRTSAGTCSRPSGYVALVARRARRGTRGPGAPTTRASLPRPRSRPAR